MRVGTPVNAHLIYPVFAENQAVLPAGTLVSGTIIALRPDKHRRLRARFNADFTPFYIPVVQFTSITLPTGEIVPLSTDSGTDGAPIFRIVPPIPHKGGFISREFAAAWQVAKDDIAIFTAPGKGDRLLQFVYGQLPYHPQRIATGTAWTVESTEALTLPSPATSPPTLAAAPLSDAPTTWLLEGYLSSPLNSATSKLGDPVRAVVAEPILNPDNTIAVPQGATLVGAVTRARPARAFGRAGILRFDFQQIILPSGQVSSVQATLKAADSSSDQVLTAEGEAKPKPQDKLALPIILAGLAARPLDTDGGRSHHQLSKDVSGSNGLGFIGRIVGAAAGSPGFAAGLGFYQTAVSTWTRWIAHGKQVTFTRDTRIVVQASTRSSRHLRPDAAPSR